MEFIIDGCNAFVIQEKEDGLYLNDCHGYVMEYEQVKEVCKGLLNYAEKHKEELEQHNINTELKYEKIMNGEYDSPPKEKSKAYIYLLECGGKYKIGVSKNIDRRIKELDRRPFKVNLLAKSDLINDPYIVEQKLHDWVKADRISGEWFDFSQEKLKVVKEKIENLGGCNE